MGFNHWLGSPLLPMISLSALNRAFPPKLSRLGWIVISAADLAPAFTDDVWDPTDAT
jgi:hypothetical protein